MANYFVNLPAPQMPRNALMDFSPIGNALDGIKQQTNIETQRADMLDQRNYQRGREAKADSREDAKWFGQQAAAIDKMQGPQRQAAWQAILAKHPNAGSLTPDYMDPMKGPAMVAAEAGMFNDPLDRQMKQAQLANVQAEAGMTPLKKQLMLAQIEQARQKQNPNAEFQTRAAQAQAAGLDPNSADGRHFILTGKLPNAAFEQEAARQKRGDVAKNISAGLENLKKMATTYDDASFNSAVGPYRGATPDGLASALPINIARGVGEIGAALGGAKTNPSEVRSNIQGTTEALAAAIKPLIRGPGEGVWTDADQARLVSIVGDLAQARDKGEYRRRLNAVRDRIKSNFNIDVQFDAADQPAAQASPIQQSQPQASFPPQAVQMLRGNPTPQTMQQFDEIFGPGASQRALGGR